MEVVGLLKCIKGELGELDVCRKENWMDIFVFWKFIYTWNPNDPCFDWKRPCFGGMTFKNRGHLGSR